MRVVSQVRKQDLFVLDWGNVCISLFGLELGFKNSYRQLQLKQRSPT